MSTKVRMDKDTPWMLPTAACVESVTRSQHSSAIATTPSSSTSRRMPPDQGKQQQQYGTMTVLVLRNLSEDTRIINKLIRVGVRDLGLGLSLVTQFRVLGSERSLCEGHAVLQRHPQGVMAPAMSSLSL